MHLGRLYGLAQEWQRPAAHNHSKGNLLLCVMRLGTRHLDWILQLSSAQFMEVLRSL